jgi:hypothetical protein
LTRVIFFQARLFHILEKTLLRTTPTGAEWHCGLISLDHGCLTLPKKGKNMEPKFNEFGKISRLNRDITITEKIDGTNAAIGVVEEDDLADPLGLNKIYCVYAQSRSRIITPEDDNFGFARWVEKNRTVLAAVLGPGLHFGEWWGVGIQRGYDLTERRFSLFNAERWNKAMFMDQPALEYMRTRGVAIYTVPVLYSGPWMMDYHSPLVRRFAPEQCVVDLIRNGSRAAPGYNRPEGVVIYHKASRALFKATCEKDEAHKSEIVR